MDHNAQTIVTRFAPSPTGFLHIGGVRTALFAYLLARKYDGQFILRIEDTDKSREVAGSIDHIQESLRWIGIDWDFGPDTSETPFGPCLQSQRLERYQQYAQTLVDRGLAYPDPYTAEEVDQFRAEAKANERPFLFRNHRPDTTAAWDGTTPLRFKVPEIKRYEWHDEVRGDLSAGEEALDDFIIMKADGFPTYNFAHIIDDHEMGVTHVMRGEEFISSMPKFLSLYDALEIEWPAFVTLPPIMRPDRTKKLGKRDGAKDILEYRSDGYLPETMMNFLALIGWNPGTEQELFQRDELIAAFSLHQIQSGGAVFNEEKLRWMNREYLKHLSDAEQIAYVTEALPAQVTQLPQFDAQRVARLTPTIFERIHNQTEIQTAAAAGEYDFAFATPDYDTALLQWKNDAAVSDALPRLQHAHEVLTDADFTSPDSIKAALWPYAEAVGKGEVLWPLRVSLTGAERSPDPFTVAYILGQAETLHRISRACDKITGHEAT